MTLGGQFEAKNGIEFTLGRQLEGQNGVQVALGGAKLSLEGGLAGAMTLSSP